MSHLSHLNRAASKLAFIGLLLLGTSAAFADTAPPPAPAAQNVQIFPPMTVTNTACGIPPAGFTYSLVWDGQTNVRCSLVPMNCGPGQGLQYDGAAGKFVCVTVCSGPTYVQTNTQSCPAGQVGSIYDDVVTQCDGSVTTIPTNTCGFSFNATVQTTCAPGSTVYGYFDNTGNFNSVSCLTHVCTTFTCSAAGPVPQ